MEIIHDGISGNLKTISDIPVIFEYVGHIMGKPRQTQRDKWAKRPEVMRYRAWSTEMRYRANTAGYKLPEVLSCIFYIEMPKSWSKKKRIEHYAQPHRQKPDCDNLVKSVQDILAKEDSYIHTLKDIRKVWWDYSKVEFLL